MITGDLHLIDLHGNTSAYGLRALIIFVSEFLRTSEFLGTPTYEDCVMFLCKSGQEWDLGFAPVSTRIGDLVCTFKDTDIITIVREIEGQFEIVGQGSSVVSLDTT
jgi:hypothetical protein